MSELQISETTTLQPGPGYMMVLKYGPTSIPILWDNLIKLPFFAKMYENCGYPGNDMHIVYCPVCRNTNGEINFTEDELCKFFKVLEECDIEDMPQSEIFAILKHLPNKILVKYISLANILEHEKFMRNIAKYISYKIRLNKI
jgi:hypothetical protein